MKLKSAKQQPAKSQSRRFIKAAREAGCSEDEAAFDENLRRIAAPKSVRPLGRDSNKA
jgi:hypothetical protein